LLLIFLSLLLLCFFSCFCPLFSIVLPFLVSCSSCSGSLEPPFPVPYN
jgi:hypothetical protein